MSALGHRAALLLGAFCIMTASGAQAAETFADYDVMTFGSFTSAWTEVNGSLAVGGSANLSGFSVGKDLPAGFSGNALTVGGNLTYNGGEVFHGNAVVGGSITATGFTVPAGTQTANAALPLNFSNELTSLKNISSAAAALTANGTVANSGGLVLTGTNTSLNVFSIAASDLFVGSGVAINIPVGSLAVINVTGSSFSAGSTGGWTLNGQTISNDSAGLASSILYNFSDATSLGINGSWGGSILATKADVNLSSGGFFGSLYADDVVSSSEFYQGRFTGFEKIGPPVTTPVPEPASWLLMIGGFMLLGVAMRRRRRVHVSFA